jgi:hypothetical protein
MVSEGNAQVDFVTARRKAFWNEVASFLSGRSNRLLAWEEVRHKLRVRGQIYRGLQAVPVDRIVGSVGRYRDFDRAFLPAQDRTADRWRSIARAHYDDVGLPPVKLYKIGEVAFVDAEVVEAQARVPVEADLDADNLEIKGEYGDFLDRTRLDELRPDQRVEFTIAGGYKRLLEHIAVHRHFLGLEQQRHIPPDEAVCDWYDSVYLPLISIIRARDTLKDFPNRTEADLYLWVLDHQHYLRERFGPDVGSEQAADHFADHYTSRPVKRVLHAVQDLVTGQNDQATLGSGEAGEEDRPRPE